MKTYLIVTKSQHTEVCASFNIDAKDIVEAVHRANNCCGAGVRVIQILELPKNLSKIHKAEKLPDNFFAGINTNKK